VARAGLAGSGDVRVAVFTGSQAGPPSHSAAAEAFATDLARAGVGIVYGGGRVGLMGVVADAALAAGGEVIGVIPESLVDWEVAHDGLTEQHIVDGLHARKALMAELSDGFIALPGGVGTMEELFEVWTWAQLGLHDKPVGLLDVNGFYDHLLRFTDTMVEQGFLRKPYRDVLLVDTDLPALLDRFADYRPPAYRWSKDG
jgi:uncharacterized protein (TIGR00730 family)